MNIEDIQIIKAGINDLTKLQILARQTFIETFAPFNTEKDMNNYIEKSFSKEQLKKELEEDQSEFYIALYNNNPAGYLKINFRNAQTDIRDTEAMEIERIYAVNELHGKGIGQLLHNKAIEIARDAGIKYIWLGVWEKNYKAQRFYEKNGFVKFGEHVFMLGIDKQTDLLMKLEIK